MNHVSWAVFGLAMFVAMASPSFAVTNELTSIVFNFSNSTNLIFYNETTFNDTATIFNRTINGTDTTNTTPKYVRLPKNSLAINFTLNISTDIGWRSEEH